MTTFKAACGCTLPLSALGKTHACPRRPAATCLNCGLTGMHADYCSIGQWRAEPAPAPVRTPRPSVLNRRCEGDAVICGMPDGSLLAHCGAGGNWSEMLPDELPLASEGLRLVTAHDVRCDGPLKPGA